MMNTFNPFPGLRPFQTEEDYLFFGREEQVAQLLELLQKHRFLAVVGSSGSGKSSLVRCGLLSQLQGGMMVDAGSNWHVAVMQPGGDPLANLAQSFIDAGLYDEDDDEILHQLMATISRSTHGLVESIKQSRLEPGSNALIVVDQFEEIFRFHQTGNRGLEQAPDFIRWLIKAVNQSEIPVYVVLTMRSDFLGDCAHFTGLAEAINSGEYLVPKLTRDQLQQAIEGPAKVAGGKVSRRLIQRLLNDVGEQPDQLPVLQHSLMRSWEHGSNLCEGTAPEMDLDDYQAVGSMRHALSRHADEILAEIQSTHGDAEQALEVTRRVFRGLTEKGLDNRGIRRPTRVKTLQEITGASPQLLRSIVDAYRAPGRTFLMPSLETELSDNDIIDISHESLMRVWQRLESWVEEESQSVRIYKRLSETALLWQQKEAGLYRDPDLQIALSWIEKDRPSEAWAARYDQNYHGARAFLEESDQKQHETQRLAEETRLRELKQAQQLAESQQKLAQEQAASALKFKRQSRVTGIVALLAVVASVFAVFAMIRAKQNETMAKNAQGVAERSQQELTATYRKESLSEAETAFARSDMLGCLLALKSAYYRDPQDVEIIRQLMKYISRRNFYSGSAQGTGDQPLLKLFYLPELAVFAEVNVAGEVTIPVSPQSVETDENPALGQGATVHRIAVGHPLRALVADVHVARILCDDGRLLLYDFDKQSTSAIADLFGELEGFPRNYAEDCVSFAKGRTLACDGHRAVVIDHTNRPEVIGDISLNPEAEIQKGCLSNDGKFLFLVTSEQNYLLYDLSKPEEPVRTIKSDSEVLFLTYLPLQGQFLTIEEDGLICLTSVHHPRMDTVHVFNSGRFKKALVSPEGTRLAVLDHSGELSMHSLVDGSQIPLNNLDRNQRFEDFVFDDLGVLLIATNLNRNPMVLSAEDGKIVLLPYPVEVLPGTISAVWKTGLTHESSQQSPGPNSLSIHFVRGDLEQAVPNRAKLGVRVTTAYSPDLEPDLDVLDLSGLDGESGKRFFTYFENHLQAKPTQLPGVEQDAINEFWKWFESRSEKPTAGGSQAFVGVSVGSFEFYKRQVELGQQIDLAHAMLVNQMSPKVLAQAMKLPADCKPAIAVTRYHVIKYLQSRYRFEQTPTFALQMLGHLAEMPTLLEARSVWFSDQLHEGSPVDLTSPELSGDWDGMAHCWKVESPVISLQEVRRWHTTNNQYITWMGAHFSDFRLKAEIDLPSGNSGIDGRTHVAPDVTKVFQANHMHPYLRQGYQADLTGFGNSNPSNFLGKSINDNYARPLVLADRGESVAVGPDHQPVKLGRSRQDSSQLILDRLLELPANTEMTLEMRGNRIDFDYGGEHCNTIYDSQLDRKMSGEVAIQAMGPSMRLAFSNIVVWPLGRDISEAEMAQTEGLVIPLELTAKLAMSRKRWYQVVSVLENEGDEQWAAQMLREANLNRRNLHRRLARAAIAGDVPSLEKVVAEIGDANLLNTIANSEVGDVGYGSQWGTPMMGAAVNGSVDVIRLLAKNGVDISLGKGIYQLEPISAAGFGNQLEATKLLLELGADPDAVNNSGYRVLHEVAKWGGPELAQLVIDAGANASYKNGRGFTAMHELAGIFSNARQFGRNRFSEYAVSDRRLEVARVFVKAGMDPNHKTNGNRSAIEIAENCGDLEMAKLLETLAAQK